MHTEAASAEKCNLVKESLFEFLTSHIPNADLSAMDDVIISYVYTAIDAVDTAPEDFFAHVTDFVEIMSAYVRDFDKIEHDAVYIWLMDVIAKLGEMDKEPYMDEAAKPVEPKESMKESFSFQIPKDSPAKGAKSKSSSCSSSRSNSTSEDEFKFPSENNTRSGREMFESALEAPQMKKFELACVEPYFDMISFLEDMFPLASHIEVKHCVTIARGDIERAMATLLHRQEHGQSLSAGSLPARHPRHRNYNAAEIRSRIIERYSYVDRESENKEHKPLAPKQEAKKLVRYRDNKIVSLKGERYTEVSKGEDEGVKKSNKKHHP